MLLVDQDVDALAELAAVLRERGIKVSLASGAQMAVERAKTGSYDVVVAALEVAEPEDGEMGVLDALSVELSKVPPLIVLVDHPEVDKSKSLHLVRRDVGLYRRAHRRAREPRRRRATASCEPEPIGATARARSPRRPARRPLDGEAIRARSP